MKWILQVYVPLYWIIPVSYTHLYRCIKELFHGLQIFFILFERPIDQQEVRQLAGYIDGLRSEYKDVVIGIGPIVCELIKFHHSFDLARDRLSAQAQPALKQMCIRDSHTSVDAYDDAMRHLYRLCGGLVFSDNYSEVSKLLLEEYKAGCNVAQLEKKNASAEELKAAEAKHDACLLYTSR